MLNELRRTILDLEQHGSDRLAAVLSALPYAIQNPIWFKEPNELRMLWFNVAYGQVFGQDLAEYAGRTDIERWGEEIGGRFMATDRRAIDQRETVLEIEPVPMPSGVVENWAIRKSPLYDVADVARERPIAMFGEAIHIGEITRLLDRRLD